mmetsp:Transcript_19866/g.14305  ORF Transcript_19866/g.14305 Transcript_19866/m.14305 type:complete len:146 (+) Transcript_19866:994-1431(+)
MRLLDPKVPRGKPQAFPTFATFIASAVWHGLYPGFTITFFGGAIYDMICKHIERVAGEKVINSIPYKVVMFVFGTDVYCYWSANFMVLSWTNCKIILTQSLGWQQGAFLIVLCLALSFLPSAKKHKKSTETTSTSQSSDSSKKDK